MHQHKQPRVRLERTNKYNDQRAEKKQRNGDETKHNKLEQHERLSQHKRNKHTARVRVLAYSSVNMVKRGVASPRLVKNCTTTTTTTTTHEKRKRQETLNNNTNKNTTGTIDPTTDESSIAEASATNTHNDGDQTISLQNIRRTKLDRPRSTARSLQYVCTGQSPPAMNATDALIHHVHSVCVCVCVARSVFPKQQQRIAKVSLACIFQLLPLLFIV